MECSIVISTFGTAEWEKLAYQRAIPSAQSFGLPVIYNHGETLHEARNLGLSQATTSHIVFLDADDELGLGFFEEIDKVEGDVRVPSIVYVTGQKEHPPIMPKARGHNHICDSSCLELDNWIVIGAVARTKLLLEVGGWRDYPILEDFDMWQRCWLAGASITAAPKALYRAHYNQKGRNLSMSAVESNKVRYSILKRNMPHGDFEWLLKSPRVF